MIPFSDAEHTRHSFPVVNVALTSLNVLVFLYELSLSGIGFLEGEKIRLFFLTWGLIPQELTGGEPFISVSAGARILSIETPLPTWTTIFSSMFIHGGFMHLIGNMMFLWVFGDNIEGGMGHLKYLGFYLAAGVVATLSHVAIDPSSQAPLVGASGAISGVLGVYLLLYPYNHVKALVVMYFITVVQLPAMVLLGFWFGLQVLNGLVSLGMSSSVDVAFFAHVGGFVAGLLVAAAYKVVTRQPIWPPKPHRV